MYGAVEAVQLEHGVCTRYGRSTARPKHAALLPVQQELPNEDDDSEQTVDSIGSAAGTRCDEITLFQLCVMLSLIILASSVEAL